MKYFPIIVTAVLVLTVVYLALSTSRLFPSAKALVWIIAVGSVFLIGASMHTYRNSVFSYASFSQSFMSWSGFLIMGFVFTLLIFFLIFDVGSLINKSIAFLFGSSVNLDRRVFGRELSSVVKMGLLGSAGLLTMGGVVTAKQDARVVTKEIPLSKLPPELKGIKIVQITDIHIGPTIRGDAMKTIVEQVNSLSPDIIAITGDLIDGYVDEMGSHIDELKNLRATYGSYFVTGNHEYYWGLESWLKKIESLGIKILINESVEIEKNGKKLILGGVTDTSAHRMVPSHKSDPVKSKRGRDSSLPSVLLAHQPKSCFGALEAGYDFMLCGHTHGGQMFPWNFFVGLANPYVKGLHDHKGMWVYVSQGTGYWGPPSRLGFPKEITEFILV